jgi:hypothetical protein
VVNPRLIPKNKSFFIVMVQQNSPFKLIFLWFCYKLFKRKDVDKLIG